MRKALAALALIVSPFALATDLGGDGLGGPSLQPRAQSAQLGEPGIANREVAQVDPVLIEAGEPALDFRFAKNKSLIESTANKSSLITFSRSAAQSPGTYVGADGLIHDAAVNLALYSEQFENAIWAKGSGVTVEANQVIAPDGKQTADKITLPNVNSGIALTLSTSAIAYTTSVWLKADTPQTVKIGFYAPDFVDTVNVTTEWQRFDVTFVSPGGTRYPQITTTTGGVTIYAWGFQFEETDPATMAPTAYIHTTSQALAAPRFDHDPVTGESLGLLVEEARANAYKHSQNFANATFWNPSSVTVSASSEYGPHGQFFEVGSSVANSEHIVFSSSTNFTQAVGTWTETIFLKYDNWQHVFIGSNGSSSANWAGVIVDLVNGTITDTRSNGTFTLNSSSIKNYGDSFRVQITITSVTDGHRGLRIRFSNSATPTYGGYGSIVFSGDANDKILIGGAQAENASFPTSYIPTEGSAQTRYADVAAVQDEDFSTTNLLAYSESFDVGWSTTRLRPVVANATTAPDGTTSADYIEQQAGQTNAGAIFQSFTLSGPHTFSVWAKAGEKNWIRLANASTTQSVYVDLSSCSVGTTYGGGASVPFATAEDAGDGWCKINAMFNFSSGTFSIAYYLADADNSSTVTDSGGIYLWGASLTATEYPVAYVTTRNLLTDSQDFERSGWLKQNLNSVQNDIANAPDGTPTADGIVAISGAGVFRGVYVTQSTPTPKTLSAYAKKGTKDYAFLLGYNGSSNVWFNLANGTVGTVGANWTDAAITDEGDGWYRISAKMNAALAGANLGIYFSDADNSPTCTSDGTSVVGYAWGAQLEPGTTATEYVRTTDVVGKKYNWYEPTEGTAYAHASTYADQQNNIVGFDYNSTNTIAFGHRTAGYPSNTSTFWIRTNAFTNVLLDLPNTFADFKIGAGWKYNDANYADNGTLASADTNVTLPIPNRLSIGQYAASPLIMNGHIKRLTYWPRRQSDSTLQVITQ